MTNSGFPTGLRGLPLNERGEAERAEERSEARDANWASLTSSRGVAITLTPSKSTGQLLK